MSSSLEFDRLWDYSNPAESEAKFREVLPAARMQGRSCELQLLTQIARAQGLQRKFDEAHATLDPVEAALEREPAVVRVRYLLERGRVFNSSKAPDRARPLFEQAWEVAREAREDFYAVDAAHMLAILAAPEEALRWTEEALRLAEASRDERTHGWLGPLYNNLGWTYFDSGNVERALELFEKALAFRESRNQPEPTQIARWCVARALRALGRVEEALTIQQRILRECEAEERKDGFVFEELAECSLALGRTDEARGYFAAAYAELVNDPHFVADEPQRLARLRELGGIED